ncbi:DUF2779 domain-containing protein [Ferrovum myxofaciens]|uniref:DUF2779 domain-containing protein n=1 Tax=Ferrovum myxofaciens TaxID=416213 RepID=UPI0004E204F9|nr:DUF2779 domain-containing protein [Ferrovum myxofaciens]
MRHLSKSKLMAYRQCPRRLWLEIHRPDLREDSTATEAGFQAGYIVGDIARKIYDPKQNGRLIDIQRDGFEEAFNLTQKFLGQRLPIFEAGFKTQGALAFADILLPHKNGWRMVEVKSSTCVKDYYYEDIAIQTYVAQAAGLSLTKVAVAHIDNSWVYPGQQDYRGLLKEVDVTEETLSRQDQVQGWLQEAQSILASAEPKVTTGKQCDIPYECGFHDYCSAQEPQAEYPIRWLPRFSTEPYRSQGIIDLRNLPPTVSLNPTQQRVKECTLNGQPWFDAAGAVADLAPHILPGYFLDFETINPAVPTWKGTRPYQQVVFQFSLHRLGKRGKLEHKEFLDLSGNDPSRTFAMALIGACGEAGPVFVYNAAFEKSRISELAERFPKFAKRLLAINERVVDLLPIARNRYYHPSQQGSWSIKAVLPAVVPELSYQNLEGVQDGGSAQDAFLEAIHPDTSVDRKEQLERQLLAYCQLDTYAMVKLWQVFAGKTQWRL